jgi:Family of unknown function (DUF6260)
MQLTADGVHVDSPTSLMKGSSAIAPWMIRNNGDLRCMRPMLDDATGRHTYFAKPTGRYIKNSEGRMIPELNMVQGPTVNYVAGLDGTLRVREWIELDRAVLKAARPPLRAFADLRGRGLQFTIPDGMSKTILQYESQSNITPATISMDGTRRSDGDRPVFDLISLPLPIIHKDFSYPARQVMNSRNGLSPLDTTTAELASRRVAETVEQLTLGTVGFSYGGGTIWGYTNFPARITYPMRTPVTGGTYSNTLNDILQMKQASMNAFHYGPWMCYCSPDWDQYMDDDYSVAKVTGTLRERIRAIEGIEDVVTLYWLPQNTLLLVQMTVEVARSVVGMDITTLQWPTDGGMMLNFKVMCILVPQLRADQYNNTGIVHGTYTPTTTTTTSTTSTTSTTTTSTTIIP